MPYNNKGGIKMRIQKTDSKSNLNFKMDLTKLKGGLMQTSEGMAQLHKTIANIKPLSQPVILEKLPEPPHAELHRYRLGVDVNGNTGSPYVDRINSYDLVEMANALSKLLTKGK
jgi:hypothetical protein